MVSDSSVKEVERFVKPFGYFYVTERGDYIQVKGTFDDLDPEPERTEVEDSLQELRREIRVGSDFPLAVEEVTDIKSRYGEKYLRIYIQDE